MKFRYHYLVLYLPLLIFFPLLTSCNAENGAEITEDGQKRSARITIRDSKCTKLENPDYFTGGGEDVYDRRIVGVGNTPTIQIGALDPGHNQEFIVNLSNIEDNFETGDYPISPGGSNQAWIIYQPTNSSDKQYSPLDNSTGVIKVNRIQTNAAGGIFEIEFRFDDIKVFLDDDTLCLSGNFDIDIKTQ